MTIRKDIFHVINIKVSKLEIFKEIINKLFLNMFLILLHEDVLKFETSIYLKLFHPIKKLSISVTKEVSKPEISIEVNT